MSKKLIYIFVILVAGLFIMSSCSLQQDAVGVPARQLDRGGVDIAPNKETVTYQSILNVLNSCRYYQGTLGRDQSCNDVCNNPKVWNQGESSGTCINAEFSENDNSSYSKTIVRCNFKEEGRDIRCVCCSP